MQKLRPPQPAGQGRPPRCRATGPRDVRAIISAKVFAQSPCRPAAGRPGPGRPAAGRPAPLAARLLGGRLSHPYIRVGWPPTPYLHHYNSRNKEKREREGGRRSPAGFSSRRLQVTKILLRFTNSMIVCPDMSSNYFCCNYFC